MRKAEFKFKAERSTNTWGNPTFSFYKASAYRWEDTADPEYGDESYHFTSEEASAAASEIRLDVGFEAIVEIVTITYDSFNEGVDFGEEFELSDLDDNRMFNADVMRIEAVNYNSGDSLDGSIIVEWSWEKYVGHCRNCLAIDYASNFGLKTEDDLISGNEERTFHSNYSVLLTKDEVEGLSDEEIKSLIQDELNDSSWKWNYFNKISKRLLIERCLGSGVFKEDEEDNG